MITHLFAVLGTLVGCTPESNPEETKKRDAEDSGNNSGFGNLVIYIVRKDKDIFLSLERERAGGEREKQKGHGNRFQSLSR